MRDEIRAYLKKHGSTDAPFSDSDSLLETGIIDSVVMIDLIAYLEDRFEIAIEEDDMIPENFDTLTAIEAYVSTKLQ